MMSLAGAAVLVALLIAASVVLGVTVTLKRMGKVTAKWRL